MNQEVASDVVEEAVENGKKVIFVQLPGESAVVKTGAENGKGYDAQNAVHNVVLGKTELFSALQGIDHRQDQAHGDEQTVKADRKIIT